MVEWCWHTRVKLLNKRNGNKNIILITDSEPTTTSNNQLPEDNMYRAAYLSGKENIRLNIIMLDKSQNLRLICEQMANLNGNSTVVYVENPLNLKEFLIHSFIKYKKYNWKLVECQNIRNKNSNKSTIRKYKKTRGQVY